MKLISENENKVVTGRDLSLFTLILIVILAFVLRIYKANVMDLYLDDAFTYWVSLQNIQTIFNVLYGMDAHPPLFYLFFHWYVKMVPGEPLFLRLPGILFGTFSVIGVYLLAKELLGRQAALITAFLTAVSASHIVMCQQVRMYAPLSFFVIFAYYFFVKLFDRRGGPLCPPFGQGVGADPCVRPLVKGQGKECTSNEQRATSNELRATSDERRATIFYTLFMIIAWYLHYGAILVTVTHNIIALIFRRRLNIKYWVYSQIIILISYIPWYKYLFFQVFCGRGPKEPPFTWDGIFTVLNCNFTTMLITVPTKTLFAALCVAVSAVIVLAVVNNYKNKFFMSVAFIGFFGPIAILYTRSLLSSQSIFQTRYFYFILPLYFIIIVSAFIKDKKIQIFPAAVILLAFLSFNFMGADNYFKGITGQRWTEAAGYMNKYYQKGEAVIVQSPYQTYLFNYYFRAGHEEYALTESGLPRLPEITNHYKRIWLVRSYTWQGDVDNKIYKWMMENCQLVRAARYKNIIQSDADVIVMLFECRGGPLCPPSR